MSVRVAVVGATGAVGRQMIRVLEERRFPVGSLRLFSSPRSAGSELEFGGKRIVVEEAKPDAFANFDVVLMSAGAGPSRTLAPAAADAGAVVIDNSSAWRMDPEVPLVVPEVNPRACADRPKGIIANPNCSTIQMVVALKPLYDLARIEHLVVSTYQAVSGKGQDAIMELAEQTRTVLDGGKAEPSVFPAPIAFNVISDWAAGEGDYSEEELKLVRETRKILGDDSLGVSPTTVRVPVMTGHAEALHVRFARPISVDEAKAALRGAPGVVLMEDPYGPGQGPNPVQAAGTDDVYVGRIRRDLSDPRALNLFVVADNLRKGAATNAVQIAELIAV